MKKLRDNHFWQFFVQHFQQKISYIIALAFLIVIGVAVNSLNPFIYGKIIDKITSSDLNNVKGYIIIYFCLNQVAILLSLLETYLGRITSYYISSTIRHKLFTKTIRMRFINLDKYSNGELISRLDSDANHVVDFYVNAITSIALITFNLIASAYFVFSISIQLSLIAILYIPASTIVTLFFRKRFRLLEELNRKYYDRYMKFINEAFNNLLGIRSHQREDSSDTVFVGFIEEQLGLIKKSIYLNNSMAIIGKAISSAISLSTLYFSAKFIIEGTLSIGSMVAFSTYISKLYDAVSRILTMNIGIQGAIVSIDRINALQQENDEIMF